jgi:hypothetical protein
MDAISTDPDDLSYFGRPPILMIASSAAARARAVRKVEATGVRIAAEVAVPEALERIDRQISASAVWLELDEDCGVPMDELLAQLNRDVASGRYAAVVSASSALVDPVMAQLGDGGVEFIIDADDAERVAALAVATSTRSMPLRLSDVASDGNAERLRQLSDEVSRIAATLARLSTGPSTAEQRVEVAPAANLPALSAETVRSVIRARRLRTRYFPEELFADPAWDMLLDLLQAELSQLRVPVSSLCLAAAVPPTTALRWLKSLVQRGVFIRRADPRDGRRVFVELAPEASNAMRRFFAQAGKEAVI